jgi:hypothetical protein
MQVTNKSANGLCKMQSSPINLLSAATFTLFVNFVAAILLYFHAGPSRGVTSTALVVFSLGLLLGTTVLLCGSIALENMRGTGSKGQVTLERCPHQVVLGVKNHNSRSSARFRYRNDDCLGNVADFSVKARSSDGIAEPPEQPAIVKRMSSARTDSRALLHCCRAGITSPRAAPNPFFTKRTTLSLPTGELLKSCPSSGQAKGRGQMGTGRLEAFTDGVMAIIITIMVLEIKTPHEATWAALLASLPILLTYLLSFVNVGIFWNNHHHMLHAADKWTARCCG